MRPAKLLILLVALLGGIALYFNSVEDNSPDGLNGEGVEVVEPIDGQEGELPDPSDLTPTENGENRTSIEGTDSATETQPVDDFSDVDSNRLVGTVLDSEGSPLAGCAVTFLAGGSGAFSWNEKGELDLTDKPHQVTGDDGAFAFEDLPPGDEHALVAHHPELLITLVNGVVVGDFGEYIEPPIILRRGKRLRGRIENEFGLPIADANIHLDARWNPNGPRASADRLSTVSDANGNYEILGIPDGKRCLTVEAAGFGTLTRIQSLIFADKTGQVHRANFTLKSQSRLTGLVTDFEGNPIPGADVLVVDRAAYRDVANSRAQSAEDGTFDVQGLQLGTYEVRVHALGYQAAGMQRVELPMEGLNIMMITSGSISGRVVDAESGEPVQNFTLRRRFFQNPVLPSVPKGRSETLQDTKGEFSIQLFLPMGNWCIEAHADGYAPSYSEPFEINLEDDVFDVLVEMRKGGAIAGRLVDGDGEPVFGGRLTSRVDGWIDDAFSSALGDQGEGEGTVREGRSSKDGRFLISNLRPTTYQLSARSARFHETLVRGVEVSEGEVADVGDIVLVQGASLHGKLFDAELAPVVGGMVFLNPTDTSSGARVRRFKSDAEGQWQVRNVVPGTYLLSAIPPGAERGAFSLWPEAGGEQIMLTGGVDDQRDIHLENWTTPKPPPPDPPSGNLGGNLLGAGGAGLVGRTVELVATGLPGGPSHLSKTEREGAFNFLRIPPGNYSLFATGHEDSAIDVTVVVDEWVNQDLEIDQ